ncbi:serine--tRNA ligase [Aestuariivirga sp. YIM B02566]|uniref:Serine--tRNA ligase n=1 Tax=Taklimakanibacter albus TaxID=2800327 RepID=A0ACC5R1X0_9HYPH|nr:serine--tRNA ligase [Aestuariivirga sp. YIM B02566]MBK1866651.1 serine--tRNA ligase [Aestuariivirga sp. YIM B02566]
MHDIKFIRDNPEAFDQGLAKRGLPAQASGLIALDDTRRGLIARLQALQERRNAASKEIGQAMGKGDKAKAEEIKAEVARIKEGMPAEEDALKAAEAKLHETLAAIPNIPGDDVPLGPDETANVEVRRVGEPRRLNSAKQHFEIGEALGLMDFETAAKISGARFVVLKGQLAQLERALGSFMVDLHTREHGYTEVAPPLIVRDETMFGTAQLPKFAEDQFHTTDGRWLIPTAEVSLTNLVRESLLEEDVLPLRVTAWTPCFRAEAGAAGRDTRGMIRQHQFAKVELVSITSPEQSGDEHERMTRCAEEVLKRLDLPYRVMALSTGDMGFSARKTYDLEVWLPGQNTYREISSCSVCGEFQARRMDARFKPKEGKGARFVHTLNGSGVAVGRALIAVLENYQNPDGSVTIPDVLRPYMNNDTTIKAK